VDEAQPGARSDDESFASVRLGATPRLAAKRSAAQRTSHTLHLRRSLSSSQNSSTTRGPRETGATIAGAVGWNLPCPPFSLLSSLLFFRFELREVPPCDGASRPPRPFGDDSAANQCAHGLSSTSATRRLEVCKHPSSVKMHSDEGAKRPCDCWVAISYTGGSAYRRRWREYACLVNGSPANHWSISSSSPSPQVGCAHCHHRRGASRSCIETELVTGRQSCVIFFRCQDRAAGPASQLRARAVGKSVLVAGTRRRHEFPNHCCESLLQLGLWW
jgi:hypothetical protein